MRLLPGAGALTLLALAIGLALAADRLTDPTRAFVEGYDPSGNDFLANVPERTVLLRIRADLDNDGVDDLALSDSSTWGNAGWPVAALPRPARQQLRLLGDTLLQPGCSRITPASARDIGDRAVCAHGRFARHCPGVSGNERRDQPRQRAFA